jgi:hypothetical protein
MKSISHKGLLHLFYDKEEYKIKTPIGVFFDINDALEVYPTLRNISRVKECGLCGKIFVDISTYNKRKYCCDECSHQAHLDKKIEHNNKKMFVNPDIIEVYLSPQYFEDERNRVRTNEFYQDDDYWGLGTGNLNTKPNEDPQREHKYILNELKRLKLK